MNDERANFQSGESIGDYEVISVLGVGATGTVYLTQHSGLKKLFAVKVLSGELAFMPEFVRVFQHEAQIVAALNHENIVPVHHFGECNGFYYYVMDFVNGGTLEDLRRRNGGRIRPDAAIELIAAVSRGLAYAHNYGVVHRDLKPENILLTRTGTPQITDFGMAYVDRKSLVARRRLDERRRTNPASRFRTVVSGRSHGISANAPSQTQIAIEENAEDKPEVEGGTEGYIAPELARGNAATPRADVYALGALLHFLLVGETPPEPGRLSPEIFKLRNRALNTLLSRALHTVPSRRYPNAAEFLKALERVGDARRRLRRTLFSALVVILVAVAFVFAFSFGKRTQLKNTETRVAAATQKFFEETSTVSPEEKISGSEKSASVKLSTSDTEKPSDVDVSESLAAPRLSGKTAGTGTSASVADTSSSSISEVADREYWERLCAERTGRRGVSADFLDNGEPLPKLSPRRSVFFSYPLSSGAYNIYLRTDGGASSASVPVRFSIGGDQISRVIKLDGSGEDSGLRFFSMIDVSSDAEQIRIEIPTVTDDTEFQEIGITQVEIRPTFSNADFSRMFGEFLSVISEK